MQSIIHHQFGEPVDVLEFGDMPKPEPKAGEVRIKTIMSQSIITMCGRCGGVMAISQLYLQLAVVKR
jgi:hypothetical protein